MDLKALKTEKISSKIAFELSTKYGVPLHPNYTYFYHDVTQTGYKPACNFYKRQFWR